MPRASHSPSSVAAFPALCLAMTSVAADPAGAAAQFVPHRAVYDITLERAASGSGVVELEGRMVYELQGSRCEGYTQNMRFVTRMVSQDGSEQVNDLRSSSWEEAGGGRLRFNSTQFRDRELVETTAGDAARQRTSGEIGVQIVQPEKQSLTLPESTYFPIQHSEALLAAAHAGKRQFLADLYDGSEKGTKVYQTSAMIGRRTPIREMSARALAPEARQKLGHVASWPISISYFEPTAAASDAVPSYELSFRLFDNGVSSDLVIDYGEFSVRGELRDLTFFASTDCGADAQRTGPALRD